MEDKKQCPLCGKIIGDDGAFCEECQNHMDNQYETRLLDTDDFVEDESPIIENEQEIASDPSNGRSETTNQELPIIEDSIDPKKRKGLSIGVIFVLIGCIVLIVVGGISSIKVIETRKSAENEESFWRECVRENTPVSYAKYLVAFQNGRYIEEADKRIRAFREAELQAWERLRKSPDINDFYAYLAENPNTPHLDQIKFLMDSLSWMSTQKDNTADAYRAYMENVSLGNLTGNFMETAKEKYDYLSQIKVLDGAALDSVKTEIDELFKVLSGNNVKDMLRIMAPEVYYYTSDSTKSSTAVVASIRSEIDAEKIKDVTYLPQKESVIVKKDNRGALFVDVVVKKDIVYDIKIKVGKTTESKTESKIDTLNIELDTKGKIRSIIEKTKKTT
ncbi:hypothetical protein LJC00_02145 [Dysgonomonas sp. OttesenSCG-928-M03]|nr:hypothetical protein [Dysgonomonas sp. OttesenSCG-928-M03]